MKSTETYPCSKCGKPVQRREDATLIEAEYFNSPMRVLFYASQHIQCSPSRAQYIIHDSFPAVVDQRPEFDKRGRPAKSVKRDEVKWTRAWLSLQ